MANRDIKLAAAGRGVKLWQIAHEYGMIDSSFSRKLRYELPTEEKEVIFQIINRLAEGVQNEADQ